MKSGYCISTKCSRKWECQRNYFTILVLDEIVSELAGMCDFYHQNVVCDKFIKIKG